jgi:hypothetical protein
VSHVGRFPLLAAGVCQLAAAGAAAAQQKTPPDITGTWVLNAAKSDFGLLPIPKADTATYTRTGNVYQVVESADASEAGTGHITYSWPIGTGKVSTELTDQGVTMQTTVTQAGDTTKFVSQIRRQGEAMEIQAGREYLSPDGRVRTREVDFQNLANPNEDPQHLVFVYDKR